MIFVGGLPLSASSSSSSSSCSFPSLQPKEMLLALMEAPNIVSASNSFKSMKERRVSVSEEPGVAVSKNRKYVYLFQREYATVDPALVDFIGTDEATTCVGLVIRNRINGMTSLAHMDSPKSVEIGVAQMVALLIDHYFDGNLDVHVVGGFEDVSPNHAKGSTKTMQHDKPDGYSSPLCSKIIEVLHKRREKFHMQTLCILGHNTERDSQGTANPIVKGLLVETTTGSVVPARFDNASRCPDEVVRRLRVSASYEDPSWKGKLLETYYTIADQFVIAPCCWTEALVEFAWSLRHLSNEEFLSLSSTSPSAENPDFVDNQRRMLDYLIKHPDWRGTFPKRRPRVFERDADGGWKMCPEHSTKDYFTVEHKKFHDTCGHL